MVIGLSARRKKKNFFFLEPTTLIKVSFFVLPAQVDADSKSIMMKRVDFALSISLIKDLSKIGCARPGRSSANPVELLNPVMK